jgi:6-phosphogluconolactonase
MKRIARIHRWSSVPVAIAALLGSLWLEAPGAVVSSGPPATPFYLVDLAFGWIFIGSDDPRDTNAPVVDKPVGSRITNHPAAPGSASGTMGNVAAKVAADYGALTPIAGAKNPACSHSDAVAIHPSGRYAYFGGGIGSPGVLCGYAIDVVTGAFTPVPGSPLATASLPRAVAIEPSGAYLYVAGGVTGNTIWGYTIDPATGTPAPIAGFPIATGGTLPGAIVFDRGGRFAYVANDTGTNTAGSISVFALDRATGGWTPIAGSPFGMDPVFNDRARSLALTPDGRFLFVGGTVGVHTFTVDANTGAPKLLAQRDSVFPAGVAVDPTGRFLYVPDNDAFLVRGFAIGANGTLTPAGTQPYGAPSSAGSRGITIVGDLVYVANTAASNVHGFRIQPATGALTPLPGSPFATDARSFVVAAQGYLGVSTQIDTGDSFAVALGVGGGAPPYRFQITQGALPPGLSLDDRTGLVSGTASGSGTYTFTVLATDSADAAQTQTRSIVVAGAATAAVRLVEFYNATLDHYFITYATDEIAKLDNGTFKGWARTGLSFNGYASPVTGTTALCRIYIPPGKGDGHFFGRDATECNGTMTRNPTFVLESAAFFHEYPPALGTCAAGQVPVYRVFSNRADANHRYTTSRAVRDQMVAKGWLAEGDGADVVVTCAPS